MKKKFHEKYLYKTFYKRNFLKKNLLKEAFYSNQFEKKIGFNLKEIEYNDSINYWDHLKFNKLSYNLNLNKVLYLIKNNYLLSTSKSLFINNLRPYKKIYIHNKWSYSTVQNKAFDKIQRHMLNSAKSKNLLPIN